MGIWKINIEVPVFLIFLAFMLSEAVFTNLVIYQTCYVTLGYNKSECALLGSPNRDSETDSLEKIVQPHATVITMTRSFIENLFNSIFCLFLGPWSDKFGRKPVLISTLCGFCLMYVMLAVLSLISNMSPWFYLLVCLPGLLCGGIASCLTVCLCYVTDTTENENRGVRMGLLEASLSAGVLIGITISSYLFRATGYAAVFLVSAGCMLVALLYSIFAISESVRNAQREGYFNSLFSLVNIRDMFDTALKSRENYRRPMVLICVLMLTIFILTTMADGGVIFMYLREKFGWSLRQFTLFASAGNTAWILGTFVCVYLLHRVVRIPETVLLIAGYIAMLDNSLLKALGTKDWHIYFAAGIGSFGSVISPLVRSLISKLVDEEETGKIFSLVMTLETTSGIIATPLYTAIYNYTITTAPEVFNYVSASFYMLELILIFAVIALERKSRPISYEALVINNEEEAS